MDAKTIRDIVGTLIFLVATIILGMRLMHERSVMLAIVFAAFAVSTVVSIKRIFNKVRK